MTQNGNGGAAADRICAEEYVVKRGDSFYLIAHKLGVPLRDLLAANRDIHPARLMVGDVLCVPREEDDAVQTPTAPSGTANNAATGSTASGAANGTTNSATNGATGDRTTELGTTILPGTTDGASTDTTPSADAAQNNGMQTPAPNGNASDAANPEAELCGDADRVTVANGQTVADIQLSHLVSRQTLASANPQVNLDSLRQGEVLCVPMENVPCALPSTYILGEGETLESVAVRFNLPIGTVLRANPCLAPQDFEQGTSIILPR